MANSTKFLLAEQVLTRLAGGYRDVAQSVQMEDVVKAIEQVINTMFQTQYYSATLPTGETIPDNLMIAFYEDIAVASYGDKAKAELPIVPISLPRNMGVYRVVNTNDIDFIPVPLGQGALLRADKLLNDLLGSVYYEVRKNEIVFSKDITLLDVTSVNMYLVVMDISLYSNTDPLPIPANMEEEIIEKTFAKFAPIVPETGIVNSYSELQNKTN
jgi:hypothetical protein